MEPNFAVNFINHVSFGLKVNGKTGAPAVFLIINSVRPIQPVQGSPNFNVNRHGTNYIPRAWGVMVHRSVLPPDSGRSKLNAD